MLIQSSIERGFLKGVAACACGPKISHLFFADDSLIFCRATREEGANLMRVLETYEQASGQQLNRDKTALYFSHNTPQPMQEDIKALFGAEVIRQHEKYLGFPSLADKNKCNTFVNYLKGKIINC